MKQIKHITAFLMMILLLVGLLPTTIFAAEEKTSENTLVISTASEFLSFSQMCRYDAYSDGLEVTLANNIDMTGLEFEDIPIFLGNFNGGGYTISGIENSLEMDNQGLFRYVSEGATVSDLTVLNSVKTEHSTIGGIVAQNHGTIENCVYNGVISGVDSIGGIAGINYGEIINCSVLGGIFGETQVGGIAGVNEGTISLCNNYADVNTDISDFSFSAEDTLVSNINPNSDTIDIADIGGITGRSDGIIQSCTNSGTVGYPHVGYNIGGIVGVQSGYITSCINTGFVQGRKEVGGIVGQFEPYVDTLYTISKLQELRDELDVFSDLTSIMADDAKDSGDLVSGQFDSLGDSIDESKNQLEILIDQTEAMVNDNIDSINEVSVTVSDTLDAMDPIVNSLDSVIEEFENASNDLEDMSDEIGDALDELEDLGDVADDIKSNLTKGQSSIKSGLSNLRTAAGKLDNLSLDMESIVSALESASYYAEAGFADMVTGFAYFQSAVDELGQGSDIIGDAGDELQYAVYSLGDAFGNLGDAMDDLEYTNDLVSDLAEDLSDRDEIVFTKLDEEYDITREAMSDALAVVGDNLSGLNTIANSSGDLLVDDLDDVTQQVTDIFDLVLEMMQDVTSFVEDETYKVEDVSTVDTSKIFAGKVTDCENSGKIEGDINVGGIAGSISFELSFDMEDDWKTAGDKTQTISRQGKAVIENSLNTGDVTAKKDSVGGILGYQDFGLVQNCTANAIVESTEGDYVGGIVGQSAGYIRSCYAKSTLLGGQFVGGIAGSAYDIQGCYSLTAATATKGGLGGIVGELDSEGILKNNFFVSDTLGGLDGISFKGMAESISYENLLLVEGLPELFQSMKLNFYVDDVLVDTLNVNYGDVISPEDFPTMAEKEGYFSSWEDVGTSVVTADLKIVGNYYMLLSTLGGAPNEAGVPTVLVNGSFTDLDTLMVEQSDMEYTIWVDGENTAITALRYLVPEGNVNIEFLQDEIWIDTDGLVDGKYIIVPLDADGIVQFRVVVTENTYIWQLILGAGIVILAIAMAILVDKKKKAAAIQSPTDEIIELTDETIELTDEIIEPANDISVTTDGIGDF